MAEDDKKVLGLLNRLHRLCDAGERGYNVSATNVSNRGLKVLLRTHAQQRAQLGAELQEEMRRLGGEPAMRTSWRGLIHRGRISIVATLTIGSENVERSVLSEVVRGEEATVRAYEKALRQTLPADTRALIEGQYEQVQEANDQAKQLRGESGQRLVVRLFDSEENSRAAVQTLLNAGFAQDAIEAVALSEVSREYRGPSSTVRETILSGALGGAIWGSLLGAIIGASVFLIPNLEPFMAPTIQGTWAVAALGGTLIGALFGALLGFLIGIGISEEDVHRYDDSVERGECLVLVRTEAQFASVAGQIMHQVNAASRA